MSVYIELIKQSDTIELSITNNFVKPITNLIITRKVKLDPIIGTTNFLTGLLDLLIITDVGNLIFDWSMGDPISGDKKMEYEIESEEDDDAASEIFPFDDTKYVNTAQVTFKDGSKDDNVPIVFGPKPAPTSGPPALPGPPGPPAPIVTQAPSTAAPSTTKKPKKKRRRKPPVTEPPKQNIMDMFNNRIVQILFLTFGIILFYIKNMLGNKIISAQSNLLVVFLVIPAYIFLLHLRLKNR